MFACRQTVKRLSRAYVAHAALPGGFPRSPRRDPLPTGHDCTGPTANRPRRRFELNARIIWTSIWECAEPVSRITFPLVEDARNRPPDNGKLAVGSRPNIAACRCFCEWGKNRRKGDRLDGSIPSHPFGRICRRTNEPIGTPEARRNSRFSPETEKWAASDEHGRRSNAPRGVDFWTPKTSLCFCFCVHHYAAERCAPRFGRIAFTRQRQSALPTARRSRYCFPAAVLTRHSKNRVKRVDFTAIPRLLRRILPRFTNSQAPQQNFVTVGNGSTTMYSSGKKNENYRI